MPEKKRDGFTQVSLQIPDALLALVRAHKGDATVNAYVCGAVAARLGVEYAPPPRGRRPDTEEAKRKKAKMRAKKK